MIVVATVPHRPRHDLGMVPQVPEETIINGQAIKKLRINSQLSSEPPSFSRGESSGSMMSAPSSPSSTSTSSSSHFHFGDVNTTINQQEQHHQHYDPQHHQQYPCVEHQSAHNPNEGPCGPTTESKGIVPTLCRSYSEPGRLFSAGESHQHDHHHSHVVDDNDVNYSIINQMLKILHFERVHRDDPEPPPATGAT